MLFEKKEYKERLKKVKDSMQKLGIEKILELGPGKVLTGLTRRIDRSLSASAVIDMTTLQSTIEEIA